MLRPFSQRLLTVLQLTRMALVFTAISNSLCALLLWAQWQAGPDGYARDYLTWQRVVAVALVSVGLYGFGMSLNDIIDRRRDSQIAADRPLPSGRIGVLTAHVICVLLALLALAAGAYLALHSRFGVMSLVLLIWTGMLITFYDFAGKYLVAPGLLTLGLIRFFHATIPAPNLPLLWHPLLLLNHVTVVSTLAYHWEQKRPPLTRLHWWAVLGGLALVDAALIGLIGVRRAERRGAGWLDALWIEGELALPLAAVAAFAVLALWIWHRHGGGSQAGSRGADDVRRTGRPVAGQRLMLYGLLWLIVYDVLFAAGYLGLVPAFMLLMLLPVAYLSVQFMRWWGRVLSLSHAPEYQRAR